MFPIKDDIASSSIPFVSYTLIAICALVFFAQLQQGDVMVEEYGMVPQRISDPDKPVILKREVPVRTPRGFVVRVENHELAPSAVAPVLTAFTCIFLHGGWMHILGNMWFLYIFGDNVEDRLGHVGFTIFYIACGVFASWAHLLSSPNSPVPTIGASGAIAGVMGAYLVLYPKSRVLALIPLGFIIQTMVVPAYLFLGIWFAIQFFQSVGSISAESGGVAWWAHTGGFLIGAVVAWITKRRDNSSPPHEQEAEHGIYLGEDGNYY